MIKVYIDKMVSDWNETEGQGAKTWCTMQESVIVQKSISETLASYGLDLNDFEDVTEELEPEGTLSRRLQFSQIENENGDAMKDGQYIANYCVYVATYTEVKTEVVKVTA